MAGEQVPANASELLELETELLELDLRLLELEDEDEDELTFELLDAELESELLKPDDALEARLLDGELELLKLDDELALRLLELNVLELEELNTELANELPRLDDELDLLLELDTTIGIELAELTTELCTELDELDSELLLLLPRLELLKLACILLRFALLTLACILLRFALLTLAALTLACDLAELTAALLLEPLLRPPRLTELTELCRDEVDEEDTTNISLDTEEDVRFAIDELTTSEEPVELIITVELGPKLLVELPESPAPPPQALNKTITSQPRPN
jgi:hypothetical protein